MENLQKIGYAVSVLGVALVLIWIGIFKFTPTEAKAIRPMVENSPLISWLYLIFSELTVSKLIGVIEIIIGVGLVVSLRLPQVGLVAGGFSAITFLVTISFIFTTPNAIEKVDGVWLPDAFILKDVMALGISIMVIGRYFVRT
jgi:reactive chlorine resistance protein C